MKSKPLTLDSDKCTGFVLEFTLFGLDDFFNRGRSLREASFRNAYFIQINIVIEKYVENEYMNI